MTYHAPLDDMNFVLESLADIAKIASLAGYEDATPETARAVLDEAARFTGEVVAPL